MNVTLKVALAYYLLASSVAHYLVGCYYNMRSQYRQGEAAFQVNSIDFSLCTHVLYSFATLESSGIAWSEPFNDEERINSLQDHRRRYYSRNGTAVNIILGVQAASSTFSSVVQQNSSLAFVSSAVQFLRQYNFDGLEFDLFYPAAEDKHSFAILCQDLLLAFANESTRTGNRRLLLGTTVVPLLGQSERSYEVLLLSSILDWVTLKAYNMLPSLETPHDTRLHSALFSSSDDDVYSVDRAVQAWLQAGMNSSKILLGMSAFGRSFTLISSSEHGLLAAASGIGPANIYMPQDRGSMPYYAICGNAGIQRNKVRAVPGGQMYSWDNLLWISFDEEQQVWDKCLFVKYKKLGGVALWSVDLDDFRGIFCNHSTYPLLRNVSSCLLSKEYATSYTSTAETVKRTAVVTRSTTEPSVVTRSTTEASVVTVSTTEASVVTKSTTEASIWNLKDAENIEIASLPPFVRLRLQAGEFSCDKRVAKAAELTSDGSSGTHITASSIVLGIVLSVVAHLNSLNKK